MPVLGKFAKNRLGLEKLLQERKRKRANQRPAQMPQPAQNHDDQHLARHMPGHQLGVDVSVFHRKQKPGQPGQRARDHKGRQLVGIGGKTGGAHALLVDADARQRPAKARAPQQRQKRKGGQQTGQGKAVQHQRLVQV